MIEAVQALKLERSKVVTCARYHEMLALLHLQMQTMLAVHVKKLRVEHVKQSSAMLSLQLMAYHDASCTHMAVQVWLSGRALSQAVSLKLGLVSGSNIVSAGPDHQH